MTDQAWTQRAVRWGARLQQRPRRALSLFAVILVLLGFASCAAQTPSLERNWYPYLGRTTHVTRDAGAFSIEPISDWRYDRDGEVTRAYRAGAYNIADLQRVWFVLEPQPGSTLAAHTFLMFEFTGDRLLGITIEARRENHEDYDALRGAFNVFELSYVWGSARDLVTRRAVMLEHQVFIYPLTLTPAQRETLLSRLVDRTAALEMRPRFYNTLTSNCTNELAKATNLPWNIAFILTGLADDHLFAQGILPGEDFASARQTADITAFAQQWNVLANRSSDLDADLLAELRGRWGE